MQPMTAPLTAPPLAPSAKPLLSLAAARRRAKPGTTVPSPCSGVCKMDPAHGWCRGCYRTLDELAQWSQANDATKLAIWARLEQRQALG
jgi:hypothetical protein